MSEWHEFRVYLKSDSPIDIGIMDDTMPIAEALVGALYPVGAVVFLDGMTLEPVPPPDAKKPSRPLIGGGTVLHRRG